MTGGTKEPGDGQFDFYRAHYGRFGDDLAAVIRHETYSEDFGQTSWHTAAEQAEVAALLELGPGVHLLDVGCGSGGPALALVQRTGCSVTGLDVEPAGIAQAEMQAETRGLGHRAAFHVADCTARLPLADGAVDAVLCIDAINHLPDRPATLREWSRVLRPGGRLLFTDPVVITGPIAKTKLDARAGVGFFLFVPPGYDEAVIEAAGLSLLRREDRTSATAEVAARWHAACTRHAEALQRQEGEDWFRQRQTFLEVTAALAASRRLSRILLLAERPGTP